MPGQAPDFLPRMIGPELALIAQVLNACRPRHIQTDHGQVLHVFWYGKRAAFQHQDSVAVSNVFRKKVLRSNGAKRTTAHNNYVERACVEADGCVQSSQGLIEAVANVSPQNVFGEGC